jgi:uncharacterized protein YeeX (DUF496 family)
MDTDRKDLKIQALLEKIGSLTTQYENQVAEMRVDLTLLSNDRDQLREQLNKMSQPTDVSEPNEEVVHEITDLPSPGTD